MNYKVISFDADGVILKGVYKFTDKLSMNYGLKIEDMLPFFLGPFKQCAIGKADAKEELAKVLDDWGWKGTVDELMDYWLSVGTEFNEEILDLVRKLKDKGIHCIVSTGQEHYRGTYLKESLGNGNPFDDVYFTAEIGCDKKDPRFFETIFGRLSDVTKNPAEVLVIDDDEGVIALAKQFGFDTILYKTREDIKELFDYAQ